MKFSVWLQNSIVVFLIGVTIVFAKSFLIPLAYSFLTAMVLYPACVYLQRKGFGKFFSALLPVLFVSILLGGLLVLLSYEMVLISGNWPLLQQKLNILLHRLQSQLELDFGWTTEEQLLWAKQSIEKISANIVLILQETFKYSFSALFTLIIIPIYVTLILTNRKRLVVFLTQLAPETFREKIPAAMQETIKMFSKFIRGMIMVYVVVGILNSLGLWIIGVERPLVFGILTAVMTIIPYFGIMISALLPITITWISSGSIIQPIGIVVVFSIVQYLEANLIFPYIVGRFVNLNTLVAILIIFVGALFWGVAGMILFLPFVAMFRIFASHFPQLKPLVDFLGK